MGRVRIPHSGQTGPLLDWESIGAQLQELADLCAASPLHADIPVVPPLHNDPALHQDVRLQPTPGQQDALDLLSLLTTMSSRGR